MSTDEVERPRALGLEAKLRAKDAECAALRVRLTEAESVLEAIRAGEVDAVVVAGTDGPQVFTLAGADHSYRIMVESMSEGAATLVPDGTLAYANARLAELLGVPLERLLGQRLADFVAPEARERFASACAAARQGPHVEELAFSTAAGGTLPARLALSPLRRSSDMYEGVPALCAVVTDLTEMQRNAELAASIRERKSAEAELRLAAQQKDAFLAMLAHELRNPLSPIRNASELLIRCAGSDEKLKALLAIIVRQTDQLTRLVDDLLDIARIAQNRVSLREEPLEIGALIDVAIETVQQIFTQKGHQLRLHKPTEALYVRGDRARLAQSFSNLLHNAAKYTDPGGTVTVDVTASGEHIDVAVRDNGIGISAELLPHVFDLFVQSERTLDRSDGGLGIGLSIVKGLIEMHRGTVQAFSTGLRGGSTFTIRLPRILPPHAAHQELRAAPIAKRRVLIVDDNIDAADSLAMLLENDGHEAETSYSAAAALEAVGRMKPHVVLLDIGLPHMDGYEVARRLRANHTDSDMRLIALTGYGQAEDRERARGAGFDAHLLKPVDTDALQSLLALDGPRPSQEPGSA